MSKRSKTYEELKKDGVLNNFDVKEELKKFEKKDLSGKIQSIIQVEKEIVKLDKTIHELNKYGKSNNN